MVVGGAPGTGKSTLAATLGGGLGAVVLRSDEIRKELAGLPAGADAAASLDTGIYDARWTVTTYRALLDRARQLLALGETVILDASWQDPSWRAAARTLAIEASAELTELQCRAPVDVAMRRAGQRSAAGSDASDADARVAAATAERFAEWPEAIDVPTTGTPNESAATAMAAIRSMGADR